MRGQDFVFNSKANTRPAEQVMQYGEDDLTFVSRLLSEAGIWFRFATDARLKIEVVEFYDDQSGYERGLTPLLRYPSGCLMVKRKRYGAEYRVQRGGKKRHHAGLQLPHRHSRDDDRAA